MNQLIDAAIEKLRESKRIQGTVTVHFLKGLDGFGDLRSMLAIAALNRSMCLVDGFILLLESHNFIASAPLLRLQIDSCLRLYACTLVDDPDSFVAEVMKGKPLNSLKSASGKSLTDAFLRGKFSKRAPWIDDVYKHTSGYVHLSDKHFHNAVRLQPGSTTQIEFKIGGNDAFVPDDVYLDSVEWFCQATDTLTKLVKEWSNDKK